MGFDNSFCTVVQACVTLLLLLALSECHYVEKRNVLLIVGNTSQFFMFISLLLPLLPLLIFTRTRCHLVCESAITIQGC